MTPIPNYNDNDNTSSPSVRKIKSVEDKTTYELAMDFVNFKLGKETRLNTKTAILLRKLSKEIEIKHEILFKNMCERLDLNERTASQTFVEVADEIFRTDINWGRIVVLYTFAGRVAVYFKRHDIDLSEQISIWVGNFLAGKSEWIRKAGGWEAFNEHFKDIREENEKFWWNSLICTTLGLGTLAAVLYTKS